MRGFAVLLMIGAALALSGCNTFFNDTAPADEGNIYVVGSKAVPFVGIRPTVWRCPAKPGRECEEIAVTE